MYNVQWTRGYHQTGFVLLPVSLSTKILLTLLNFNLPGVQVKNQIWLSSETKALIILLNNSSGVDPH